MAGAQGSVPSGFRHQPFYCEENVYKLCLHPALAAREVDVVFVSNASRQVAMLHQRAARPKNATVIWDYHVFLIAHEPDEVWDLDSLLGVPVEAKRYFEASFVRDAPELVAPCFRVISRDEFVEAFASDRSHMRGGDGRFTAPPPPWSPIGAPGRASNLMQFVDMSASFLGEVFDLQSMRLQFEAIV